jgi:N-methylhydantoinase B
MSVRASNLYRASAGDVLSVVSSGGGGYGDPFLRDRGAVIADVRSGLLSPQQALELYGLDVGDLKAKGEL